MHIYYAALIASDQKKYLYDAKRNTLTAIPDNIYSILSSAVNTEEMM